MRRLFITVLLIIIGIKYGYNYIYSEDFQNFADKNKGPWTCHVNNFLGGLDEIASDYHEAISLYERVLTRCPNTPMAEEALFHRAACLENVGRIPEAKIDYMIYAETYPQGKRVRTALAAIERIRFSK